MQKEEWTFDNICQQRDKDWEPVQAMLLRMLKWWAPEKLDEAWEATKQYKDSKTLNTENRQLIEQLIDKLIKEN